MRSSDRNYACVRGRARCAEDLVFLGPAPKGVGFKVDHRHTSGTLQGHFKSNDSGGRPTVEHASAFTPISLSSHCHLTPIRLLSDSSNFSNAYEGRMGVLWERDERENKSMGVLVCGGEA